MGILVQLSDRRRERRAAEPIPEGGATIHLFLGVRYERHEDSALPTQPRRDGGGGRRTRKRA
jgi:hypothetical protein